MRFLIELFSFDRRALLSRALILASGFALFGCSSKSRPAPLVSAPPLSYQRYIEAVLHTLNDDPDRSVRALEQAILVDPGSAALRIELAHVFLRLGRFREARALAAKAARLRPRFADVYLVPAWIALYDRRLDEARRYLLVAFKLAPRWRRVLLMLVRLYRLSNQPQEERRSLDQMIALDSDDEETRLLLALHHRRQGRLKDALVQIERVLSLNPWSVGAMVLKAYIYMDQRRPDKASVELEEAVQLSDDDLDLSSMLFRHYMMLGKKDKAMALLKRLEVNSAPTYWSFIAERFLDLDLPDMAEKAAKKALVLDRGFSHALCVLSELRLRQGRWEEGLKLAMQASHRKKGFVQAMEKLGRAYVLSGRCTSGLVEMEKTYRRCVASPRLCRPIDALSAWAELQGLCSRKGPALALLSRKVSKAGLNTSFLHRLAVILEIFGSWQEALRLMDKLMRMNMDETEAINFTGYTLAENNHDLDRAVSMLRAALKESPINPHIMDSLGWALLKQGKLKEARIWLEKAYRVMPGHYEVTGHLAELELRSARLERARILGEKALSLRPMPRFRKQVEALLARTKSSKNSSSRGKGQ